MVRCPGVDGDGLAVRRDGIGGSHEGRLRQERKSVKYFILQS